MSIKNLVVLLMVLVSMFLLSGTAYALNDSDIKLTHVEVNDAPVLGILGSKDIKKSNELDILISFDTYINSDDFQVQAIISSTDLKGSISDITDTFTVKAGNNYDKRFNLKLPIRIDQARFDLRLIFSTRTGPSVEKLIPFDVSSDKQVIEIRDVVVNPEGEVAAGRQLFVTARIKNRGTESSEDIKIKASIPELGVSASDYVDSLDAEGGDDDSATTEELYLRIPNNAKTGDYTLKVEVEYDDGDESETKTSIIHVRGEEAAADSAEKAESKTYITLGPESQDIALGGTGIYTLTLINQGNEAKSYTVDVTSASWGAFKVSPSNVVVVNKGESKALTISVEPKDTANAGEQSFAVTVKSGDSLLKQVLLKANLVGKASTAKSSDLRNMVEIGLIVLVVLLVIVALIIGFSKLKGDDEKPKEETYY